MNRYWTSWWIKSLPEDSNEDYPDEAVVGFRYWITGNSFARVDGKTVSTSSICAPIYAESEVEVWKKVRRHFQVIEERFCNLRNDQTDGSLAKGGRFV